MHAQIKLGRIFGIELGLHYSWLIIAALIAFSLAAHFHAVDPAWSPGVYWGAALITSVLFFAGLFVHELSHALVAQAHKIPVRRITLFALGGVAQIEKEAPDASTEFRIAIAGPVASCVLGAILVGIALGLGWKPHTTPNTPVLAVLVWLGYINVLLGIFNMIPGFPLDGGRVFRAIVWQATGSGERAMRMASRVGQWIGGALIFYGIFRFFTGAGFAGLWLCFIGWFLLDAARASYMQYEVTTLLKDLKAGDLMARDCISLDAGTTIQEFVDEYLLRSPHRCFVVTESGRMAGLITPRDVRETDRSRWREISLRDLMRPMEKVQSVSPETPVSDAVELMAREDLNQLPVVANQNVAGMITRGRVLQALRARMELGSR